MVKIVIVINKEWRNKRRILMKQLTLQVEVMSCGHCVNAIERSVKELTGVWIQSEVQLQKELLKLLSIVCRNIKRYRCCKSKNRIDVQ